MDPYEHRTRIRSPHAARPLVFIEFLAGMQRYLSQTVLPLAASELDGAHLYGPLDAAAQAPMFLMMPVGAWLLSRYHLQSLIAGSARQLDRPPTRRARRLAQNVL